jgi:hypothetical protein
VLCPVADKHRERTYHRKGIGPGYKPAGLFYLARRHLPAPGAASASADSAPAKRVAVPESKRVRLLWNKHEGHDYDHLTSVSLGRAGGSGLGAIPSA